MSRGLRLSMSAKNICYEKLKLLFCIMERKKTFSSKKILVVQPKGHMFLSTSKIYNMYFFLWLRQKNGFFEGITQCLEPGE